MVRLRRLMLVLGCLVGIALAAFAMQAANAHAGPPAQDVTVINSAAQPVPVAAQGTTAIQGNVGIVGTPNVNATVVSAPPVQLAPGSTVIAKDGTSSFVNEVDVDIDPNASPEHRINYFTVDHDTVIRNISGVLALGPFSVPVTNAIVTIQVTNYQGTLAWSSYFRLENVGTVSGPRATYVGDILADHPELVVDHPTFIVAPMGSTVQVLLNKNGPGADGFLSVTLAGTTQ